MKDGTTHRAYKPEHAIDLDTGAVVAAEVHAADQGDTTTITGTLDAARRNLTRVGAPPSPDDPAECVADKGYHSRAVLKDLDEALIMVLVAHSAIPALIVVNMRFDRRSD